MHAKYRRFTDAAERALSWIIAHQKEDGSFCSPDDGIRGYYKVPYALAISRRQRQGLRLADWIAKNHFTSEGNFGPAAGKADAPDSGGWPTYFSAWLVQGLHRLGRWDLSFPGAAFLLRYQLPAGGFYALDQETRFFEPVCTSWGGLASLTTGNLESARRAGDLLARMVDDQPDLGRFYFRTDTSGRLQTEVPGGEELFYFVDSGLTQQIYYNPGIALIFLTQLYQASGEDSYLNACRELFAFTERCADGAYAFPPSGKLGLGCALLFQITSDAKARRAACRVGDYLVETQTSEGIWQLPDAGPYRGPKYRGNFEIDLDIAAEFAIFLSEIAWRI